MRSSIDEKFCAVDVLLPDITGETCGWVDAVVPACKRGDNGYVSMFVARRGEEGSDTLWRD